ncbi:MAG: hypothetical protein KDK33_13180, partial [Leptospiraceae bacterium]|nr:hypothetical protein [Leptospiraceae bacterium]
LIISTLLYCVPKGSLRPVWTTDVDAEIFRLWPTSTEDKLLVGKYQRDQNAPFTMELRGEDKGRLFLSRSFKVGIIAFFGRLDGSFVALHSDLQIHERNASGREDFRRLPIPEDKILEAAFSGDGKIVFVASLGGYLSCHPTSGETTLAPYWREPMPPSLPLLVSIGKGKFVTTLSMNGTLIVRNLMTGALKRSAQLTERSSASVAAISGSQVVVVQSAPGAELVSIDCSDDKIAESRIIRLPAVAGRVTKLAVSIDGRWVGAINGDGKLMVFDAVAGEPLFHGAVPRSDFIIVGNRGFLYLASKNGTLGKYTFKM